MGDDGGVTDDRPAVVVSACLLGTCCNHEGSHQRRDAVVALGATHRVFPVCPEALGGLPTPRSPAEVVADDPVRVVNGDGEDVTEAYRRGAVAVIDVATAVGARRAVLKARSPSCGASGVTTVALRAAGVEVVSEEDLDAG